MSTDDYSRRIQSEIRNYADVVNVHDLPAIFHYNSTRHWTPKFQHFGFSDVDSFYLSYLTEAIARRAPLPCRILSVGAGNCDTEVGLAKTLAGRGLHTFDFACMDLNPSMLERGTVLAAEAGLGDRFHMLLTDVNGWKAEEEYDIVIANQSLHHFLELETLFEKIKASLAPGGLFLSSDMIGRNGHMRWPEALAYIEVLWRLVEERHTYNHQLKRTEPAYENWDCSKDSFEGIRSQDILPLLVRTFAFDLFLGFGNLIDIFVDRSFGHNFDPERERDRVFIDLVAELDDALIESGRITPTHMLAAMAVKAERPAKVYRNLTPEFCIRRPDVRPETAPRDTLTAAPGSRPQHTGAATERPPSFPDGHFYSPVVNVEEALSQSERLWPPSPAANIGIDFNARGQRDLLIGVFPLFIGEYDYPEDPAPDGPAWGFHTKNSQFSWLDARALFVMLRRLRPARMIEIGSGFSSLLSADVNRRFLGGSLDFTCIEPYPRPFLLQGVPGISRLIEKKVQDVPIAVFEALGPGDILFVDSSHVSKTGSDVNQIVFEIVPRLAPGVVIHFHDIFLPAEYPRDWVLDERRSWNEQYLLRALLMDSQAFEVVFGSSFAFYRFPDLLRQVLRGHCYGGGSLWIRKR